MVAVVLLVLVIVLAAAAALIYFARKTATPGRQQLAVDSFALAEPWRRHVAAAESAQRRYATTVKGTQPGPLQDRLREIERDVHKGLEECWQIAKRGAELDDVLRLLHPASLRVQLERSVAPDERDSLQRQVASAERILQTRDDADERLRMLNVRLGELVTQSAEVSIGIDATRELGAGVESVVTELEALRLAVEDFRPAAPPSSSPGDA